jgi:hypothetical protein
MKKLRRKDQLMKLGAARQQAPSAWRLVAVEVYATKATFSYRLNKDKLRQVRRREGRYLLQSNLTETDPAVVWSYYLQLVQVEQAFRNLKGDLAIRPIFHQQRRIEAHTLPLPKSAGQLRKTSPETVAKIDQLLEEKTDEETARNGPVSQSTWIQDGNRRPVYPSGDWQDTHKVQAQEPLCTPAWKGYAYGIGNRQGAWDMYRYCRDLARAWPAASPQVQSKGPVSIRTDEEQQAGETTRNQIAGQTGTPRSIQ